MNNEHSTSVIRFSHDELELFSAASGDRNPLHVSDDYAHKTALGRLVVFGVLGAIAALGRIPPHPKRRLVKITLGFPGALFIDVDYTVRVAAHNDRRVTADILDGSRVMLVAEMHFEPGRSAALAADAPAHFPYTEPADRQPDDLDLGVCNENLYCPDHDRARALLDHFHLPSRGIGALELGVLLWASYFVGMEMPGKRALFGRLAIDFDSVEANAAWPLTYTARTLPFDPRFDLLRCEATLSMKGRPIATAKLRSFVRRDVPAIDIAMLQELLPQSESLKGKIALVTGASRGLGAAIAAAMALEGCTVIANYRRSRRDVEQLVEKVEHAPGEIVPAQGDAGDPAWWAGRATKLLETYGGLDILVCNASPPLVPMSIHAASIERINTYINQSVSLVSAPLGTCADLLAKRRGWLAVISSTAVDDPPPEWPHYVGAKCAVEGLARATAAAHDNLGVLIVRPPRLRTEFTNVPMGHANAIAPERVAADLVRRLAERPPAGEVHYLVCFDPCLEPVT